jgi:hypothetical protein
MRQGGSGIAWQGFSQVRLSHLTCHPDSATLSSQFNLMRHVRSAGLMGSMHREDPARQAVLPAPPFPARGPGRSCYPKRTTPGTRRAELDDLWTPTRFGNLIILRAESAVWCESCSRSRPRAIADRGLASPALAAYVAGIVHRWDLRRPSLPGPGCPWGCHDGRRD